MRWRVTYDLQTTMWHAFGRHVDIRATSQAHAIAAVERWLYAKKDIILAERHDEAGEDYRVIITAAVPCDKTAWSRYQQERGQG